MKYAHRKLEMSREMPRESRLFANELVQGAPRMADQLSTDLRGLVDSTIVIFETWMAEGKLAPVHPRHLLFSIWSLTQHYADFDAQVRAVLGGEDPFPGAEAFLDRLYTKLLIP